MPSMRSNKTVDEFLETAPAWRSELSNLRTLVLTEGLEETIKWGGPVYCAHGKNVVGIGAFKSYFGLWFFQGALLADKKGVLINAQEGRTKALRQWRFTSGEQVDVRTIKSYLKEAVQLAKNGQEIKPDRKQPVEVPPELLAALKKNKRAKTAFDGLRLGKQREYTEYIASAKQLATKIKRLEKIMPMICEGMGLNDKYR